MVAASAAANIAPGFRTLQVPITQALPLYQEGLPVAGNPSHEYRLCLRDRVVCLRQTSDTLFYRSEFPLEDLAPPQRDVMEAETLAWIRDYFQLDVDLLDLYDKWSEQDPVFRKVRESFSGIRILRQDPFECLMSFICSSNNNITRITNMVNALCKKYSPPLLQLECLNTPHTQLESYHPFPRPSALVGSEVAQTLRTLGFGYRAEFIQKTAKMLVDAHGAGNTEEDGRESSERWLKTLRDMPTAEAREELLKFMGVGRKVADCVLLMSMDKADVVPVDTHVYQIAVRHYGLSGNTSKKVTMSAKLYEQVTTKFVNVWGPYAGWAHSVLFTSDLKAFAGEQSAAVALSATKTRKVVTKRTIEITEVSTDDVMNCEGGLADRVKRRRRNRTAADVTSASTGV